MADANNVPAITPMSFREIAMSFQKSRIFLTAYELEVFTVLGEGSKTAAAVAQEIGADPRATDRLLNALCALGLLEKKRDEFHNIPPAAKYLVQGKPEFLSGLGHAAHLWESWSHLTTTVREGKSGNTEFFAERGEEWLESFIAAMHERAYRQAPLVVSRLNLEGVRRVLDVGGGSGAYAMAFVRAGSGIQATVFDLAAVTALTQKYIQREGLSGRIDTKAGNYHTDDFGDGYDLLFLSAIIHINSPAENQLLINRSVQALNPHGQVVIQDFIMNEERTSPLVGAIFALNMLVGTQSGDTYSEKEIAGWLTNAGLTNITKIDNDNGAGLMCGRKIG